MSQNYQREEIKGYISHVSPKRPCRNLKPQFDIIVQSGPNTTKEVRGFGEDSYAKLLPFNQCKSPVKMLVVNNPQYSHPSFNEKCYVRDAKFHDVPFDFVPSAAPTTSRGAGVSNEKSIKEVLASPVDDKTYFTVKGKLHIGSVPVKIMDDKRKLKDDIFIFDESGYTRLTLWNGMWDGLTTNDMVQVSHVKLRKYDLTSELHLTTSPFSKLSKSIEDNEAIVVPDDFRDALNEQELVVTRTEDVGIVNSFSSCKKCATKVKESEIRTHSFTCSVCKKNRRIEDLSSSFIVTMDVKKDEEILSLFVTKEAAITLHEDASADNVADYLLMMENVTVTYNARNYVTKMNMKVSTD